MSYYFYCSLTQFTLHSLWYVLGEKNIIGLHDSQSVPNLPMWLIISGTYTLDNNGKVVGYIRAFHEK